MMTGRSIVLALGSSGLLPWGGGWNAGATTLLMSRQAPASVGPFSSRLDGPEKIAVARYRCPGGGQLANAVPQPRTDRRLPPLQRPMSFFPRRRKDES
ncbi:MAG: hypothetical protein FJY82_07075 [Candidatus Aminicenantes bacterium]|nr:hypothetical protein [Candidatus Aminicenantes bacterium]